MPNVGTGKHNCYYEKTILYCRFVSSFCVMYDNHKNCKDCRFVCFIALSYSG